MGTYRLQTGQRARDGLGNYSEREFDFSPFESTRGEILELGRACIHARRRNFAVLKLLWKGIGACARDQGARYLIGCSSFTTQDATVSAAAYQELLPHLSLPAWRARPRPEFACPLGAVATPAPRIPRLLSAYLAMGSAICGPPALDREFKTVDFLTWVDMQAPALVATLPARPATPTMPDGSTQGLSGFRLLPLGTHSLDARLQLIQRSQSSQDLQ